MSHNYAQLFSLERRTGLTYPDLGLLLLLTKRIALEALHVR